MMVDLIEKIYSFLWGDLVHIPLPGGSTLGISLLIILLIPAGIYFTIRTRFLPIRLFPDMVRALVEKKKDKNSLSSFQALVVSTATRLVWEIWSVWLQRFPQVVPGCVLDVGNSTDRFIYSIY